MIKNFYERLEKMSKSKRTLWVLFFAAILTRLLGALVGGTRSEDDDRWHYQIAQNFLQGNGFRLDQAFGPTYSWIQPGLAAIHVVFMLVFKDNFMFPERIFLHLFSAATILAYFFLARRLFSSGVALLSTIILIFYPPQWFWMTRLNPHAFATNILIFAFLIHFISIEKKSWLLAFVVGFLWGALTLMRPEYQMGFLCLAFSFFFVSESWFRKLTLAGSLVLGFVVFISPWVIRNYRIHQRLVISTTHYGINLWYVFNPNYQYESVSPPTPPELEQALMNEPNEVRRADIWMAEGKKFIRENPGLALERVWRNFLTYWRPWLSPKVTSLLENVVYVTSYVPIFLFFLWGLFKIPWRDPRWIALVTFMAYKMAAHVPFYMIVRFREATMPLMLLIATLPLQSLIDGKKESRQ
ncbi:MAG: hypothetical protein KCHDKBKB_01385 [Elusimicrobia bacterium]|nr:hypothetical protein [Elusimicrobiota bacterium]